MVNFKAFNFNLLMVIFSSNFKYIGYNLNSYMMIIFLSDVCADDKFPQRSEFSISTQLLF